MKITDRYASAIGSSNLRSRPETAQSDTDVLGAFGLAARGNPITGREGVPLAVALTRLFSGDNRAAVEIVGIMADMLWGKAAVMRVKVRRTEAEDMARAVLAWHRNGTCPACGGHGYAVLAGTTVLGDVECPACHGTGKRPFERNFRHDDLARWLLAEIERESGKAGPAAMLMLAGRMDL